MSNNETLDKLIEARRQLDILKEQADVAKALELQSECERLTQELCGGVQYVPIPYMPSGYPPFGCQPYVTTRTLDIRSDANIFATTAQTPPRRFDTNTLIVGGTLGCGTTTTG